MDVCHSSGGVFLSQYADDFVLYTTCSSISSAQQRLQLALNKMTKLLLHLGLEVSPTKSSVCIFKNGVVRDTVTLKINEVSLPVVNNVKYLGVWLDRSLRWAKHINETREKVLKLTNVFKILSGSGWGIHPKHLRRLYISTIRSRIDYACFLYDSSCETHLSKLDRVQNVCMRVIGGFLRTTAIHVMENELNLQPLKFRRYYLAGKYWLKIKSYADNNIMTVLQELQERCQQPHWRRKVPLLVRIHDSLESLSIYTSPQLEMFSLDTWVHRIDLSQIVLPRVDGLVAAKKCYQNNKMTELCTTYLNNTFSDFYKIYTDGSKDKIGSGAAFFDPLKVNSKCNIMYIELIAIEEALSYIDSFKSGKYVILCDSKSALQHLVRCTTNYRGTPVAYSVIKSICKLISEKKNIVLQWIPAHVGLEDNEIVDRLAKDACDDGLVCPHLPVHSDFLYTVREDCSKMWQEHFDQRSLSKGIWYRTIQPTLSRGPWFDQANMSRSEVVMALRLRSGHVPMNSFAYLMGKVTSPNCPDCSIVEDTYHILMECVRNEAERISILPKSLDVGRCNSILAFPLSKDARAVYKLAKIGFRTRL